MILDNYLTSEMPRANRKRGATEAEENDKEYWDKRERNNEAVKKSRLKSRQRTQETTSRVDQLKEENQMLEEKIKTLTKGLQLLKELFLAQATISQLKDVEELLNEIPDDKKD